ncbi:MAG: NAD(P)H-binding protein [Proteobacteria bacterium]|nr:NAD(P)H-binding protein [Pseudomonadota bacterium]
MSNNKTVLVLGATGGIGGEVTRQLAGAGWEVRALHRDANPAGEYRQGTSWVRGDAMNPGDVAAAARGCSVIVHAVNPPGYQQWAQLVLPMLRSTLAAAQAHGATVVLPGNVYNYGPDAFPVAREDSPQNAQTRKGRIRVEMEKTLKEATQAGCRAIVVSCGDFFGPRAGNNWFSQALVKPGKPVDKVYLPGRPGVPHQWGYLPDVG